MVSLSQFRNLKIIPKPFKPSRTGLILGGFAALGVIFATLLALDGYIFYQTFWGKRQEPASRKISGYSGAELDKLIELLDERAAKLGEVLSRQAK